ncbi:MAG TPA: hypothetical protein VFN23_12270, partial [Ktedonobacteraceae bacterium]|nr:hypothetical protein [Ktedonobacteraceae bacterium]
MTTSPQLYMTLSEVLHQENFPSAVLNVISPVADHIAYLDSYLLGDETGGMIFAQIQVIDEAVLNVPLVDGLALVVGGGPIEIQIIRQDGLFEAYLQVDEVRLRFPRSWLQPVTQDSQGNYVVDPDPGHFVEIDMPFGLRVTDQLEFELLLPATQAQPLSFPTAMIGNTGVVIAANDILLRFSSSVALPPGGEALGDDWRGVFIQSAAIYLPKGLGPAVPADLTFQNCYLGTGGFSGQVAADWSPVFSGTFFGATFGLEHFALSFIQNTIVVCDIRGIVQLPFFNAPVEVEIGINLDGTIAAKLTAPGGLYTLSKPGVLNMQLQSISFAEDHGNFITKLSGQLTPQFAGLNWPSFAVKELSIDSQGHLHLDGGWLNLPSQYHLNFYGFAFEIDKLGFGNNSDGGRWIGLSGGLKLVDGMPAGVSVDGLRLTWYEDGRAPQVSLKGVGVELTVPDVLHFKGAVSYDSSSQEFHGSITLNLMALHMEIDGAAVFGTRQGHTYLALYLSADWPAGIPLFATGVGLYGIAGLLVLNMTPNKLLGEEWYGSATTPGWYLRAPVGIVQSIGSIQIGDPKAKWVDAVGDTAFGAGVTLGTLGDNGRSFSGRVLLAIVFPGPILMIEGKANLLQDRATLDKDPTFRALAVLDVPGGTFDMHLDALYRNDNAGRLIDVRGGAEAFFSLHDASAWHLYLGEQDHDKRIRAKIFQLFEADAYLMLNSQQLAMGAWIGYNNHWNFGPLSVTLQAWLDSNVLVSWHPVHFQGNLWLHGSVQAGAFGFNVGLTLDARLDADVFDPFHIKGELDAAINLPFNINFNVSVTLEWGPTPTVPALPAPLQDVAIEHFKTTTSWPLPRDKFLIAQGNPEPQPATFPLVPLDSRPHITFSRPVHDDALIGVNAQPLLPEFENIGDPTRNDTPLMVRYGISSLVLEKYNDNGTIIPATSSDTQLYGS